MTLDNDSTLDGASSSEQPSKPARRRVTRSTAAPKIEPVQFLKAEPVAESAPKTTVGRAEVFSGAANSPETVTSAPRRSRRVVSSGKAATTSVAVSGTASQIAEQATQANERANTNNSTEVSGADAQQTAASGTATGQRAKRPAAKRNTKASGAQETPVPNDSDTSVEESSKVSADTGSDSAARNAKTTSGKSGSAKKQGSGKNNAGTSKKQSNASQQDLTQETVSGTADQQQLDVFGELASGAPKSAKRNGKKSTSKQNAEQESENAEVTEGSAPAQGARADSRTRNRRRSTAPSDAQVESPDEAENKDSSETQVPANSKSETAAKGTGRTRTRKSNVFSDSQVQQATKPETPETTAPSRPRLATTALLFQAPDLSAVPARSAGAQITEAETEEVDAPSVEETETAEETEQNAPRANRRDRGRNRNRNRAQEASEPEVEPADTTAEPTVGTDAQDTDSEDDNDSDSPRRRRRRGGRGRRNRSSSDNQDNASEGDTEEAAEVETTEPEADQDNDQDSDDYSSSRRRRRRRRTRGSEDSDSRTSRNASDEVTALKGSTRLEAKRQRRREGRDAGRRRTIITEAEFLARRESVERSMVVRERDGRTQIAVLEDGVLVEHYVSQQSQASMAGNVYLGRVQNVLPSMEAAFVDIGKGRNAVLYAGEVNWDIHGVDGQPRRIEDALKSGDSVLVQVTKDPIGHKGARLTSQVTLAGRYLVFVPGGGMTGISRKLPDTERNRLKRILREVVPEGAGVIVRTAAEGASEEELTADIERLRTQWEAIEKKSKTANAPALLQGEPDLAIRVVRDIFNDDFSSLKVQGDGAWNEISEYVKELAPDLADRVSRWTSEKDIFSQARIDEQLTKGMDRKVWLPSGGSLVIDRTEAMTVIDVNTGKFTGAGGTLEETVTRNNLEAAEEIVRQLRLRDIGGIIVIDFIDMVLESNRDLVLRRLVECLGRDRTKHQVAEVTSLGLVQMTRKRVGQGLVEAFSTTCDHCNGRGFVVHEEPNEKQGQHAHNNSPVVSGGEQPESKRSRRKRSTAAKEASEQAASTEAVAKLEGDKEARDAVKAKLATIAAAAAHAHGPEDDNEPVDSTDAVSSDAVEADGAETEAPNESVEPAVEAPVTEAPTAEVAETAVAEQAVAHTEAAPEPAPVEGSAESETTDSAVATTDNAASDNAASDNAASDEAAGVDAEQPEAAPKNSTPAPVLDVLAEFGFKDSGKN